MARKTKPSQMGNPYQVRENDPTAVYNANRILVGHVIKTDTGQYFATRLHDGGTYLSRTRFHGVNFVLGKG